MLRVLSTLLKADRQRDQRYAHRIAFFFRFYRYCGHRIAPRAVPHRGRKRSPITVAPPKESQLEPSSSSANTQSEGEPLQYIKSHCRQSASADGRYTPMVLLTTTHHGTFLDKIEEGTLTIMESGSLETCKSRGRKKESKKRLKTLG